MTDEFRHRTRLDVRFRDLDAFGHVNNAVTTSFVEHGRITYVRDVLAVDPVGLMPLILANLRIDYTAPAFFGETIEIDTRVDWIGRSSLGMTHRLAAHSGGHEVARADAVLVAYDYDAAKPMPVPEDWRSTLAAYEGRDLARP